MSIKKVKNQSPSHILSIGDFVKEKPCLIFSSQDTLYDIVNIMREQHSFAALVMEKGKLLGMLTEHKILLYLLPLQSAERVSKAFNILKCADAMIKNPSTIDAKLPVENAFEQIMKNGYRYMPVIDSKNSPVGILNSAELVSYIEKQNRKELEAKDMMLSYLMHHENYGCL